MGVTRLDLSSGIGEFLPVVHLLEVQDGLLAEGDVFGEEVVKVVVDARVPDTATISNSSEHNQGEDKVSESSKEALLLGRQRGSRRGRRRRRRREGLLDGGLGLSDIVDSCLVNSL